MTIRFRWLPVLLALLALLACPLPSARAAAEAPPFGEVFELVRTNLPSLDAAKLNQMAVEGLVQRLGGLAQFTDAPVTNEIPADLLPVATAYEGGYGYVRLGEVSGGVAARLAAALAKAATTNQLKGLVLDLRFAGGRDFATAAQVADLFLSGGKKVLDWGESPFVSTEKTNAFTQPLAVLVNHETRGSAEAVAASLRHAGSALILGNTTAGEASLYREFTLSNGRRLRLAVTPVLTGDGETIPGSGLVPDIAVAVRPETERAYLMDPFALAVAPSATGATNRVAAPPRIRKKLTEADLVRARQEGKPIDAVTNAAGTPVELPKIIRDPVLARAVDLLKGLSVVHAR